MDTSHNGISKSHGLRRVRSLNRTAQNILVILQQSVLYGEHSTEVDHVGFTTTSLLVEHMTRAVHKWRKVTIDQLPPPSAYCSVKRCFFARENATAPVLTSASWNENSRFNSRDVTRGVSLVGPQCWWKCYICHNLLPFTRRSEWLVQFFFHSFFQSPSDLPGSQSNTSLRFYDSRNLCFDPFRFKSESSNCFRASHDMSRYEVFI